MSSPRGRRVLRATKREANVDPNSGRARVAQLEDHAPARPHPTIGVPPFPDITQPLLPQLTLGARAGTPASVRLGSTAPVRRPMRPPVQSNRTTSPAASSLGGDSVSAATFPEPPYRKETDVSRNRRPDRFGRHADEHGSQVRPRQHGYVGASGNPVGQRAGSGYDSADHRVPDLLGSRVPQTVAGLAGSSQEPTAASRRRGLLRRGSRLGHPAKLSREFPMPEGPQ